MQRSQTWFAPMSVCQPGISDNVHSDKEGRVACCKKTRAPKRATRFFFCVDGQFVPCCKEDVLSATKRRHVVCAGRMHELAFVGTELYHLLLRDGSMFSLWVFCRHLEFPSVQPLWCGILRWTLTQFGRYVHVKRGCLIHVVGVSTGIGCVSVDVWPNVPNMSLIHATH